MRALVGVTLAAFAASTIAVVSTSATASGNPDPKMLVLQLSDLPTGFGLKNGHYTSNVRAARESGVPVADYIRWGRINGYEADYSKDVSLSTLLRGPFEIHSFAVVYRTAAGAHRSFTALLARTKPQFKREAVGAPLGNESRLFTFTQKQGQFTLRGFIVTWRSGRLLGSVLSDGLAGGVDAESAVYLARKQQRRMRRVMLLVPLAGGASEALGDPPIPSGANLGEDPDLYLR